MRFKKEHHSPIDKLIEYRETVVEEALEHGSVTQETYKHYKELARIACQTNPLARELPDFTISLLSQFGSKDAVEFAIDKELNTNNN